MGRGFLLKESHVRNLRTLTTVQTTREEINASGHMCPRVKPIVSTEAHYADKKAS